MFFPLLSIVKAPVRPADRQSNGHPAVRNGPEWSPAVTNGAQRAETVANGLQRAETGPQRAKPVAPPPSQGLVTEIGRRSSRDRVCQSVLISVVDVTFNKTNSKQIK